MFAKIQYEYKKPEEIDSDFESVENFQNFNAKKANNKE
jgi:hypothetical protein